MSVNQTQSTWPLQKPQQLVYVELGPDNGGMVLGICEQGLSYRAVAPLRVEGPVYFTFSPDGKTQLRGAGEIVWSEEGGKSGGLKFTSVSPQFREELRAWLVSESTPKTVGREVTPAAALPLDSLSPRKSGLRHADAPESQPAAERASFASTEASTPAPQPAAAVPAEQEQAAQPPAFVQPIIPAQVPTPIPKPVAPQVQPAAPPRVERQPVEAEPEPETELRSVAPLPAAEPSVEPTFSLPNFRLPLASVTPDIVAPDHTAEAAAPAPPKVPEAEAPAAVEAPAPEVTLPNAAAEAAPDAEQLQQALQMPSLIPAETTPPWPSEQPETQRTLAGESEQESPKLNRAAAAGIIGLALAILLAALVLSFRREVGETLIRLGEALSGEERKPAATQQSSQQTSQQTSQQSVPSNAPAQNPVSGSLENEKSVEPSGAPLPAPGAASQPLPSAVQPSVSNSAAGNSTPANSSSPNAVQRIQDLPPATGGGSGQKEFEQARNILKGNHRQRDIATAVDLLWAGVRKGYVPAEVTLADLYARGDGVAQSCAQARVLLEVAVRKGSPEGRRRLEQLKRQGCS